MVFTQMHVANNTCNKTLSTYPSFNPTLTLACYRLMVFWVRGGEGAQMLTFIPNVSNVSTEFFFFSFFTCYNFSVWTVLRGLQGKNWLLVCITWIMHAINNLILGSGKLFGWTDICYYRSLGKYWERGGGWFDSKIWWKVTQSVSNKTSYVVVGQDPGEHKLSKVNCNIQIKKGKKKH